MNPSVQFIERMAVTVVGQLSALAVTVEVVMGQEPDLTEEEYAYVEALKQALDVAYEDLRKVRTHKHWRGFEWPSSRT